MRHTIFTGAATAIITPMTETGVDYDALGRLIDFQLEKGIDALVAAGTATAQNLSLFTETTMYTCYMWIGGIGATLSLVLLMCFSKSKELNALGKACLAPGILNINEPVVFGAIAWNPYLMIPMWIQGPLAALTTWAFTKWIPIAKIPRIMFELWYCPYPISTWISTEGHLMSIVFVLAQFALQALVWYPFFKAYEKVKVAEEAAEAAK